MCFYCGNIDSSLQQLQVWHLVWSDQCARFTQNPRKIHDDLVKRICHYLVGTLGQGLTFDPNSEINMDFYVDTYFTELLRQEQPRSCVCEFKNWLWYEYWRMSITLGVKASDRYFPVNFGSWINSPISGYSQSTTFKAIDSRGWDPVEDGLLIPHHHALQSILEKKWQSGFGDIN